MSSRTPVTTAAPVCVLTTGFRFRGRRIRLRSIEYQLRRIAVESDDLDAFDHGVKIQYLGFLASAGFLAAALVAGETATPAPDVPYPEGYRTWRHICSAVLLPGPADAPSRPRDEKNANPHGLIHHVYANDKALEGYRTGHFPEGAVLIADWFVLEPKGRQLVQGPRKSINVMVRDARYSTTGGWGFEDFDQDSRTTRNVATNAIQMCFQCHERAKNREYVFSEIR